MIVGAEPRPSPASALGMTLIEIIIVIALIAAAMAAVGTTMLNTSETEVAIRIGQLASDVRGAYDTAVLTGKPHRLVFTFGTGDYHLEVADRERFFFGDDKLDADPTLEQEQDATAYFDERFAELEASAGEEVVDPETQDVIKPSSPVVKAKENLRPVGWTRVTSLEWSQRTLGPELLIQSMQAEHHRELQKLEDLGLAGRAFIYFMPSGYVEKAVIHIAYNDGDGQPIADKLPYSVVTEPMAGVADVLSGIVEVDVHADPED